MATVLLTGSRIKIGQQICLSLLRSGATVIATTRFPVDMQQRFAEMADFAEWGHRLHIYRVDLRNLGLVTAFCHFLRTRLPFWQEYFFVARFVFKIFGFSINF